MLASLFLHSICKAYFRIDFLRRIAQQLSATLCSFNLVLAFHFAGIAPGFESKTLVEASSCSPILPYGSMLCLDHWGNANVASGMYPWLHKESIQSYALSEPRWHVRRVSFFQISFDRVF